MNTLTEQTNSNNDLVHVRQMSQSNFDALPVKSPTTIYFVNLTGVFTEQSLGKEGDIYLGDKLLTAKPPRLIGHDTVVWVSSVEPVHDESFIYDITEFNAAGFIEINASLVLGNNTRTQRQAVFYLELCRVTSGQSGVIGEVTTAVYTVEQELASVYMEVPSGSVSQIRLANAHLHAVINGTRSGTWALRVRWAVIDLNDGLLQPIGYFPDAEEPVPMSKLDVVAWQFQTV